MRVVTILILMIFSFQGISQEHEEKSNDRVVTINLLDGSIITGSLSKENEETITVNSSYGTTTIERKNIKSLTYTNRGSSDEGRKDDSYGSTHYLLTQSGYTLRKGQSYYENTYLFFNSYTRGYTDNFSLSFGGEAFSLLAGNIPTVFVTPKYSIPFSGGAFSVSTTIFTVPSEDFTSGGFLQGSLTLGDREDNFTIGSGIGYGFSGGFDDGFIPIIISGMTQVSPKISLVSENWFITSFGDFFGILSAGVRIHSRTKNNFLTVGLVRTTEDQGGVFAVPFISGLIAIK